MAGNKHWVGTWAAAPAPAEGLVGFMRSVWLLKPTTASAGAGAAAQVPTQCLLPAIDPSLKSPVGGNRAAAIGVGAMILTRR